MMPDHMETMESAAEARLDDMTAGLPAHQFRCDCGKVTDFRNAQPASAHPYAMPVCPACMDKIYWKTRKKD